MKAPTLMGIIISSIMKISNIYKELVFPVQIFHNSSLQIPLTNHIIQANYLIIRDLITNSNLHNCFKIN